MAQTDKVTRTVSTDVASWFGSKDVYRAGMGRGQPTGKRRHLADFSAFFSRNEPFGPLHGYCDHVSPRTPAPSLRHLRADRGADARQEPPSDAEVAYLVRQRDPRGAALVWDRYAGVVRGVVYRAIGPSNDIEDVVQDVFAGLFKNIGMLREPPSLRPFLVSIAIRKARTALRKRRARRWLRLSDDGTLPDVTSHDGDPRTRETVRRLHAILDELDDRGRLAFVLRHAEGYELTETAAALGVSLATVKRALAGAEAHVYGRARDDELLCAWTEAADA
jgi:RNA polymerase sigma-70 factor (ECF subfamily)